MPAIPVANSKSKGVNQSSRSRSNRAVMHIEGDLPIAPPVGLNKEARSAWSMAIACAPGGLLTALEHSILERWARNYALYRRLAKDVEENGVTELTKKGEALRAQYLALMKTQTALAQCEKELGFTPVSRARVSVSEEKDEGNEFDDF